MYGKVIDVSKYQKTIDFNKVKASGVKGVIIRCAYRGYGKAGTIVEDECFYKNVEACNKAGLPYGVYFFSQATNKIEAVEEAKVTLNMVKKTGVNPAFPVYIDSEYGNSLHTGRADKLNVATRTEVVKAFCDFVEASGYYAGIYASTNWLNTKLNVTSLNMYDVWVAQYASKCTYNKPYGMWQYSSSGSVPGISGRCDMNNCYKNYPNIIQTANLNGFTSKPKLYSIATTGMTKGDVDTVIKVLESIDVGYEVKEV